MNVLFLMADELSWWAQDVAGLAQDTLIIFTSDHGEMLGEKGFWTKSATYDSAARVPLILAGPGIEPGNGLAWKYVHYADGHPPQLFDLTINPDETDNLASGRPRIVTEARQRLDRWMDPEMVNARAHADRVLKIETLGGRARPENLPQFDDTPADSR